MDRDRRVDFVNGKTILKLHFKPVKAVRGKLIVKLFCEFSKNQVGGALPGFHGTAVVYSHGFGSLAFQII